MKGYGVPRSLWLLLILLILGGLIGSLLGTAFGNYLPILNQNFQPIGMSPTTVDLLVIKLTFGILLNLNVASIAGFLLALFLYFRIK